jgi:membrane-associated phospholipid phosphatase
VKIVVWGFPAVVLAVMISTRFFDARIALTVMELLQSSDFLQKSTSNLPDALFLLVSGASCLFWMNYLYLRLQGTCNDQRRFSQLAGSVLPFAYFLKWVFKYVFGGINTRAWLMNPVSSGFHWFHGGGDYNGFPSGHMTVFTAFFAAIWMYYPRHRRLCFGTMLTLAIALIVTDYHFLSDVIAGAYLGLIATSLAGIGLMKCDTVGYDKIEG